MSPRANKGNQGLIRVNKGAWADYEKIRKE
jgi:hypothetical protein